MRDFLMIPGDAPQSLTVYMEESQRLAEAIAEADADWLSIVAEALAIAEAEAICETSTEAEEGVK